MRTECDHIRVAAEYDASLRIADHAPYERVAKAIALRDTSRPAIPQPEQAFGLAADPQIAFAILVDRQHPGIAHEIVGTDALELVVGAQPEQAGRGADPHVAVAVAEQALDANAIQFRVESGAGDAALAPAIQPGAGAEPQAVGIRDQMRDARIRQGYRQAVAGHALRVDAGQSTDRADPQCSVLAQQAGTGFTFEQ